MKNIALLIYLLLLSICANAQQKFEKETRIKQKDVPEEALRFVEALDLPKRIKWYKEIGTGTISFEAKTRYNGKRMSIEFSKDGLFEDLEVEIKPIDIPQNTYPNISAHLDSVYSDYKLVKTQIQYSGDQKLILQNIQKLKSTAGIFVKYEIVLSTKVDGSFVMFEYLFDDRGYFVKKSQIILKMTDNLEF